MGLVLPIEDGPLTGASIGATYPGKALPAILANIGANTVTCPKTGKLTSQRDNYKVFLINNRLTGDAKEKLQ
jgi:hypothetical protein